MIFRQLTAWVLVIACALALPTHPARADVLTVSNVDVPLYDRGIGVFYNGLILQNIAVGQIQLTATDSATPSVQSSKVGAWCVDLYHAIYIGQGGYAFSIGGSVTTDGNGGAIAADTSAKLMTLAAYGNALLADASTASADVSSAIQLAIWQTEYKGLTFYASSAVTADVAQFEAYAANHTLGGSALMPLNGQQALITNAVAPTVTTFSSTNVPEPLSAALLGTGLVGLGLVRRRGDRTTTGRR